MTQNTLINAMFPVPTAKSQHAKNAAKCYTDSDRSFMNFLNDTICSENRSENAYKKNVKPEQQRGLDRKGAKLTSKPNEAPYFETTRYKETSAIRKNEAKYGRKIESKSKDVSEAEFAPEMPDDILDSKDDVSENIDIAGLLQSLIKLLQDMMAKLSTAVTEETVNNDSAYTTADNSVAALAESFKGDFENMKNLFIKMDGTLPKEFEALLESVQRLAGQLTETKDQNSSFKIDAMMKSEDTSLQDLISKIKVQSGEIVKKLDIKIAELKDQLSGGQNYIGIMSKTLPDNPGRLAEGSQGIDPNEDISVAKSEDELMAGMKAETKTEETDERIETKLTNKNIHSSEIQENSQESFAFNHAVQAGEKTHTHVTVTAENTLLTSGEKLLQDSVTDQVIMKVKLMTGENKQEVEVNLKPESLGRLSLKIVHERGEVLAKITAESEQVKEILESNMQLLKDALEKSGLSVQSLSVSVGNGQDKNRFEQNPGENNKTYRKGLIKSRNTLPASETLYLRSSMVRDYYDSSSQINITA